MRFRPHVVGVVGQLVQQVEAKRRRGELHPVAATATQLPLIARGGGEGVRRALGAFAQQERRDVRRGAPILLLDRGGLAVPRIELGEAVRLEDRIEPLGHDLAHIGEMLAVLDRGPDLRVGALLGVGQVEEHPEALAQCSDLFGIGLGRHGRRVEPALGAGALGHPGPVLVIGLWLLGRDRCAHGVSLLPGVSRAAVAASTGRTSGRRARSTGWRMRPLLEIDR